MIIIVNENKTCDFCKASCKETFWIEFKNENGEKKDLFVCPECYRKIKHKEKQ